MVKADLELIEFWIELITTEKAEELGVMYRVKARIKESCLDVLVRIKSGNKNNGIFAEYIGHLICDKYHCDVRFSYPLNI